MNERQLARRIAKALTRLSALWRMPDQITQLREDLMAREAENYAKLQATIGDVKTAVASYKTENEALREALRSADADAERRVDEALAADSEHDADAMEALDAALREVIPGQPVEVPADGGGDGADSGTGDTSADQPPADPASPAEDPAPADPASDTPADDQAPVVDPNADR